MTHLPWMQIYIGDELAEASHLSAEEYGAHCSCGCTNGNTANSKQTRGGCGASLMLRPTDGHRSVKRLPRCSTISGCMNALQRFVRSQNRSTQTYPQMGKRVDVLGKPMKSRRKARLMIGTKPMQSNHNHLHIQTQRHRQMKVGLWRKKG